MTTLIIAITMAFNFSSVEIKGDKLITKSLQSSKYYTQCEFNLSSDDLLQDIQESEGECFNLSVTSIY